MDSHLSAVWRALNVPVARKEGEAGSKGWVFSRCVCATCQKPGASWDGPPTGPCASDRGALPGLSGSQQEM